MDAANDTKSNLLDFNYALLERQLVGVKDCDLGLLFCKNSIPLGTNVFECEHSESTLPFLFSYVELEDDVLDDGFAEITGLIDTGHEGDVFIHFLTNGIVRSISAIFIKPPIKTSGKIRVDIDENYILNLWKSRFDTLISEVGNVC